MVAMSRIRAMSCEIAHTKKIGTFVRRNTCKGSVISEPPLNSYLLEYLPVRRRGLSFCLVTFFALGRHAIQITVVLPP